jgi:hypothetical protein
MSRKNHPGIDPGAPHAIDHSAYKAGFTRPEPMLALEEVDDFWLTLGGSKTDPWGDQGETFRQRQKALDLGIGTNIYWWMKPSNMEAENG